MLSQNKLAKAASGLDQVAMLEFATHFEALRGHLTVLQHLQNIPFPIARIFYIHGTPPGCARGAHAHYETEQVLIAVAGSFTVEVTNGQESRDFALTTSSRGVYVPAMMWVSMRDFSPDAVCLVLASTVYEPADYIRDWERYVAVTKELSR